MSKRRFTARQETVKRELKNTMEKINATSLKIQMDEFSGEVKVIFDRAGKRYTKTCQRWENSLDNLRAIGLSIAYLYRAIEVYGVQHEESEFDDLFNSVFVGIEATPDSDVLSIGYQNDWWEILGVDRNATRADIINAYKSLARIHHPDVGGTAEAFKKLRGAYDKALKRGE